MRTHGWQGEPPRSDEDAVARIVAAADRCVRRRGGQTTIADVAAELGVSRKTVYRYFPSTTALLRAVATEGTRKFLEAMAERLSAIDDIAEAVVEGVVLTVTAVPDEPYLQLLLEEPSHALLRSITSETARRVGQQVLVEHTSVDWERTPMASWALDEVVEWSLRAVHSFLANPSDPPRDADQLRGYLRRWLAPAIKQWVQQAAAGTMV